ncbi:XRE family transcriptional regulator [Melissococcus sp. OM08-11BH]|nr:XRE family transcriptional regulator [Melissococcus sp. OM08-11BH]
MSEILNVSKSTVSNWEIGKTTPDLDSLIRLANLCNLSLDNLLLEKNKVVKNIIY